MFFNGHGGDNFFKIQDTEVLQSEDLSKVFNEMYLKNRYKEVLMMIDTCQAMSLFEQVETPNLFLLGTSIKDESAWSAQPDSSLNLDLNDKFSYHFLYKMLRGKNKEHQFTSQLKLSDLEVIFNFQKLNSHL
mmetsp:Transcript_18441/g.31548  ORF Transcript_18441/g.31548 Transcript_18441/m.31548 type:complete len:132 (-) Transcript_18441:181-576(-)